ncbi:MAG: phosphate ABC transporter substrate-binding protein PstS [Scytonema sp. PMC 1069.18]|nr:phosphate ABC transporter substrate-binding protein PstS [Scytonema sp. PMC 1069.18]MEC4885460.1 phosphate ABC transporter substrate-binding protein PstS [Scytonema sp. PMC 1070.18]
MLFSTTTLNLPLTTSLVTFAVFFGSPLTAIAQAETLKGAGATFPEPLYKRYSQEVKKKHPDLVITYQGTGSGNGVNQFLSETVDFAGSDAAITDTEKAKVKRGVVLVPTAGGAVSVVYNLPGVKNLKLSRKTLPAIFSGQITNWSDPQIKADNPGVNLPNLPIRPIVRADSSGTTFIFSNHLSSISPYFKSKVGAGTAPNWTIPNILKERKNSGVAGLVSRTRGAIGYVEYGYALKNKLNSAQIQNKQGQFISPSVETANQALSSVEFPSDFRVFINDPAQGYPIVGLTWMMVYRNYPNANKGIAVRNWVNWVLTEGQKLNQELNYTRIPTSVAERVMKEVNGTGKK